MLSKESSLRETYEKAVAEGGDPLIMLINSPSNPTGAAFTESTVKMISKFCEDRDIVLISDEIYSDIYFEDDANVSVCSGDRFNAGLKVLTGGLSKVRAEVETPSGTPTCLQDTTYLDIFRRRLAGWICHLPFKRVWRDCPKGNSCILL